MSERQPVLLDWLLLLVLALIWGASFIFIKRAVQVYDPVQMAMWRMVLATLIYIPVAAVYWSRINWKYWKYFVAVAFFGSAIPNFLFAVAQRHVDSSLAGVLNALAPLFTLLIGMSFFANQFKRAKIIGVLIGLAGAIILILGNQSSSVEGNWFFAALCALATLCYAINANLVQQYLKDQHPAVIASAAFMLSGILFFAGLWASDGYQVAIQHPKGLSSLGYILYLSSLGTVGGSILYFWLLQRTSAIFATSVTYLLPVIAIALGALDGEALGLADYLGTSIILTGVYLTRN
jgi:drug/metabolite transporter (DMT)-like permease